MDHGAGLGLNRHSVSGGGRSGLLFRLGPVSAAPAADQESDQTYRGRRPGDFSRSDSVAPAAETAARPHVLDRHHRRRRIPAVHPCPDGIEHTKKMNRLLATKPNCIEREGLPPIPLSECPNRRPTPGPASGRPRRGRQPAWSGTWCRLSWRRSYPEDGRDCRRRQQPHHFQEPENRLEESRRAGSGLETREPVRRPGDIDALAAAFSPQPADDLDGPRLGHELLEICEMRGRRFVTELRLEH